MFIPGKVLQKLVARPRFYDQWQLPGYAAAVICSLIIRNAYAILVKLRLRFPPAGETMQVDLNFLLMQCFQFIKQVNHTAIISGIGNVERYYVKSSANG